MSFTPRLPTGPPDRTDLEYLGRVLVVRVVGVLSPAQTQLPGDRVLARTWRREGAVGRWGGGGGATDETGAYSP